MQKFGKRISTLHALLTFELTVLPNKKLQLAYNHLILTGGNSKKKK